MQETCKIFNSFKLPHLVIFLLTSLYIYAYMSDISHNAMLKFLHKTFSYLLHQLRKQSVLTYLPFLFLSIPCCFQPKNLI